jgi:tRNA(fMet)-specific endonuclease VapC
LFLFDTDHLVIIQQATSPEFDRISEKMVAHEQADFFVSIVTFHEQVMGWSTYLSRAKSKESVVRAYAKLRTILVDFAALQVLPFDEAAVDMFEAMRDQRVRVGTMDLRIATTALARDYTVLTRNLVDFQKVPGLRVENWADNH